MKQTQVETILTPTKALRNLLEEFEGHNKRIRMMEQQYMDLCVRMNTIEEAKHKKQWFPQIADRKHKILLWITI